MNISNEFELNNYKYALQIPKFDIKITTINTNASNKLSKKLKHESIVK